MKDPFEIFEIKGKVIMAKRRHTSRKFKMSPLTIITGAAGAVVALVAIAAGINFFTQPKASSEEFIVQVPSELSEVMDEFRPMVEDDSVDLATLAKASPEYFLGWGRGATALTQDVGYNAGVLDRENKVIRIFIGIEHNQRRQKEIFMKEFFTNIIAVHMCEEKTVPEEFCTDEMFPAFVDATAFFLLPTEWQRNFTFTTMFDNAGYEVFSIEGANLYDCTVLGWYQSFSTLHKHFPAEQTFDVGFASIIDRVGCTDELLEMVNQISRNN